MDTPSSDTPSSVAAHHISASCREDHALTGSFLGKREELAMQRMGRKLVRLALTAPSAS